MAGISLGANFSPRFESFLDDRQSFADLVALKAFATTSIPDGFEAYVISEDKKYKYLSTNTDDATTGKWREIKSAVEKTTDFDDAEVDDKLVYQPDQNLNTDANFRMSSSIVLGNFDGVDCLLTMKKPQTHTDGTDTYVQEYWMRPAYEAPLIRYPELDYTFTGDEVVTWAQYEPYWAAQNGYPVYKYIINGISYNYNELPIITRAELYDMLIPDPVTGEKAYYYYAVKDDLDAKVSARIYLDATDNKTTLEVQKIVSPSIGKSVTSDEVNQKIVEISRDGYNELKEAGTLDENTYYNVADTTDDEFLHPEIYSLNEIKIGYFLDKPLYRKVITIDPTITITGTGVSITDDSFSDIQRIINSIGMGSTQFGYMRTSHTEGSTSIQLRSEIGCGGIANVILEYTKISD